jgi:hypothetical protein
MLVRAVALAISVSAVAAAQTVTLTGPSGGEVLFGQYALFDAKVPDGSVGTVTFTDNGEFLASRPVSGGHATLSVRLAGVGVRTIRAIFNGASVESKIRVLAARPSSFTHTYLEDVEGTSKQVSWRDLNSDGLLDKVVIAPHLGGPLGTATLNVGNGTFGPVHLLPETRPVTAWAFGDFTGDGNIDIVTYLANTGTLSVLPGNGNATFRAPEPVITPAVNLGTDVTGISTLDADGDGRTDLLITKVRGFVLLLQSGNRAFTTKSLPETNLARYPALYTGDMNGDGRLDIFAVGTEIPGSCATLLSSGSSWVLGPPPAGCRVYALADVNGDGRADMILQQSRGSDASAVTLSTAVQLAQSDGSFGPPLFVEPDADRYWSERPLTFTDWNSDGKLDVVLGIEDLGTLGLASVRLGNGDGTFATQSVEISVKSTFAASSGYRVADLNGDTLPELLGDALVLFGTPQLPPSVSLDFSSTRFAANTAATVKLRVEDGNTVRDLRKAWVLISGGAPIGANACFVEYDPVAATVRMRDDADGSWTSPVIASSGAVQMANSQCEFSSWPSGHVSTRNGPAMTFEFQLKPKSGFLGDKNVYVRAMDSAANDTGFVRAGNITVVPLITNTPPTATVTPAGSMGQQTTFDIVVTDPDGRYDTGMVRFAIGPAGSFANACAVLLNLRTSTINLYDDAGSAFVGSDSSGGFTNKQCAVSSRASFAPSGAGIRVTLPVTFQPGFAGGQVGVYAAESTTLILTHSPGIWTPAPEPAVRSLTSTQGSGSAGTFRGVFESSAVGPKPYLSYTLFLPTPNVVQFTAKGTCLIEHNAISNGMRLIDDVGTGWIGPVEGVKIEPGAPQLRNSVCSVNVAGVVRNASAASTVDLSIPVTFDPGLDGVLGTFLQAFDQQGKFSGMTQFGNWTAFPRTRQVAGPAVQTSVLQQAGSSATLRVTATHSTGIRGLSMISLLVGKSIMDRSPCQVIYFPWKNTLHLINDDGTALVGGDSGVVIGVAQSLANSRCAVHPSLSTSTPIPGGVRLDVRLSFVGSTFAGPKNAHAVAFDVGGLVTHWVDAGTLTVQ